MGCQVQFTTRDRACPTNFRLDGCRPVSTGCIRLILRSSLRIQLIGSQRLARQRPRAGLSQPARCNGNCRLRGTVRTATADHALNHRAPIPGACRGRVAANGVMPGGGFPTARGRGAGDVEEGVLTVRVVGARFPSNCETPGQAATVWHQIWHHDRVEPIGQDGIGWTPWTIDSPSTCTDRTRRYAMTQPGRCPLGS